MSNIETHESAAVKNCFLTFRNRKSNTFEETEKILETLSGFGYYFDKVAYISYSDSEEIIRALQDAKDGYSNVILYCPKVMENTLKKYVASLYGKPFDELGILKAGKSLVFIYFTDKENRLQLKDVKRVLDAKYGIKYDKTYVKTVGAPVTKINSALKAAKAVCPEIDFNVTERFGDCCIEIIYSSKTPKMVLDDVLRQMVEILNDYIYSFENSPLAYRLFQLLKLRRMKISTAESFTGGGVSKKLVEIPGVSSVYFEGLNTYSNEAKMKRLGVQEMTLKQYGAVSPQTAYEMAEGLLNGGKCDICISTTGIAGPKSDNSQKPVGLLYIAIGVKDTISVYKYNLKGDRREITETAVNLALFHAFKTLK